VDLGGDVRANPKLSGTKHNVFGIQTGVAISFMVKKVSGARDNKPARVHYLRRPEMETADEKLAYIASHPMRSMAFDEVSPDKTHNWVNLTNNDFETLIPLASKETKAAKTAAKERAIFKLFSLGVNTARDEWLVDRERQPLIDKVRFFKRSTQNTWAIPRSTTVSLSGPGISNAAQRSAWPIPLTRTRYCPMCTAPLPNA